MVYGDGLETKGKKGEVTWVLGGGGGGREKGIVGGGEKVEIFHARNERGKKTEDGFMK